MKVFILCGGFGTRLDYDGKLKAKPMVKIGNKPILMYIIENFCKQGFNEFIFSLGYKSESISNYCKGKGWKLKLFDYQLRRLRRELIYKFNKMKF